MKSHKFLSQERKKIIEKEKDDDKGKEDSDLDYGDDDDSDDDDEYEDTSFMNKPWQQRQKEAKKSALAAYEDSEEESEEEMEEPTGAGGVSSDTGNDADLVDFLKVTLPRRRLARWCREPYFSKAVIGCYVRLFVGESEDRKKCYRLCEITGVKKGQKQYKFPTPRGEKPVSTQH